MRHLDAESGEGEAAEIKGILEIEASCLYVASDEVDERLPVVWPRSTSWNADAQQVVLASGLRIGDGVRVDGGGGYYDVDDVRRLAGKEAADLANECVDNRHRDIAIVNNQSGAVEPA